MPCYDGRDSVRTEIRYESGISPSDLRAAKDRCAQLEAALCAILNELDFRGIASEVAAEASRHGLIDIMSFWCSHKLSDEARIAKQLHKFSKDEQKIIKKLLDNTK